MAEQSNNSGNNPELDQNKTEKPLSAGTSVALTGFVGGLLWSAVSLLAYYFNFMEISPRVLIYSWAADSWKHGALGIIVTILLYGLLSIGAAFLYYLFFRKVDHLFVGILYGAGLWAIIHTLLVPLFPGMKKINELSFDSLTTTICLFIIYGVFIGVSISFDESERQRKKEVQKKAEEMQSS